MSENKKMKYLEEGLFKIIDEIWNLHLNGRISNSKEARKMKFKHLHSIALLIKGKKECDCNCEWCVEE